MKEFNIGDVVTFCAYQDQYKARDTKPIKAIVRKITEEEDGIIYHLRGDVISQTSGRNILESVLYKPNAICYDLMDRYELEENVFKEEWLTPNCLSKRLQKGYEIIIRHNAKLVELFLGGKTIESIRY